MIENPNSGSTNFDTIFYSFLQVFQCVTLEGWTQILELVRNTFNDFSIIYFIFLVFIGAFFLMNITLAIIKIKFSESHQNKDEHKLSLEKKNNEILFPLKKYKKYLGDFMKLSIKTRKFHQKKSSLHKKILNAIKKKK